ncbi:MULTISPECIES: AlwI family type II restriction endonuclease [Aerococcus]|uniref:AlwI family type II restriction endonuclease n=1 Tax=Aerococcus TaxID=1375 RepID=UPI0018A731D9|nr:MULTISPECIES: AlwI family type II restriction endonuclease [Aerococcus]MCY3067571.1 AlwI family type II restriction endonuclease [Aerococcus mictus]MCY3080894.1 AlwI family type II restriction endonuclease [Aerococcus mictus]MDK8485525.1 AlwI family type II restriction endonuclease [Aerococcus urinae]
MKLSNKNQVFNLMNTNGRRNDVINAYTIYMEILRDINKNEIDSSFTNFPNSLNQFIFYKEAITRSPEIFKKTPKYDHFVEILKNETEYYKAFHSLDGDTFTKLPKGKKLLIDLDKNIEQRARHYTSNLSKIGFVYNDKQISPVGRDFVDGIKYPRDIFEVILPIDNINLIFLRQMIKLRIYNKDATQYYSPMNLCLYILLNIENVSSNTLLNTIQIISPFKEINIDYIIDLIKKDKIEKLLDEYTDITDDPNYKYLVNKTTGLTKKEFNKIFKNRKSSETVDEYYDFYINLYNYLKSQKIHDLKKLKRIYIQSSSKINKAFNFGKKLFDFPNASEHTIKEFHDLNPDNPFLEKNNNINILFLKQYNKSKRLDSVSEYSDTLKRLLTVTGIISFKNGIANIQWKDLWNIFFDKNTLKNNIFKSTDKKEYNDYEISKDSIFCKNISLQNIYQYSESSLQEKIRLIKDKFNVSSSEEASRSIKNKINDNFIQFIKEEYPIQRLSKLLSLFSDRSNDKIIKLETNSVASVPTIFEYLIGIAWYYISDKPYDVFSSFRLTMNADFIPETHAGGGDGDIIINYNEEIVMLEVTLMNKQAQKRGEWEPVLRHATNLNIDYPNKKVTTFFIADELDSNTINIWRAVASVPLESSRVTISGDKKVQGVIIMPLENKDVISLLSHNKIGSNNLIDSVNKSFDSLPKEFDINWRKDILNNLNLK